jgi:hypothetical protein
VRQRQIGKRHRGILRLHYASRRMTGGLFS